MYQQRESQRTMLYKSPVSNSKHHQERGISRAVRFSSRLTCSRCSGAGSESSASSEALDPLVKVQLPVVGVSSPSCALWKSPKSPKPSNDVSSISSEKFDPNVNGSAPLAAAESENGPNVPSSYATRARLDRVIISGEMHTSSLAPKGSPDILPFVTCDGANASYE